VTEPSESSRDTPVPGPSRPVNDPGPRNATESRSNVSRTRAAAGRTLNRADVLRELQIRLGDRSTASDALAAVTDVIIREVAKGGSVAIAGFGTCERAARAARTGRNPRTGQTVRVPKTVVPRFRAGVMFKDLVRNPDRLPHTSVMGGQTVAKKATAKETTAKKATTKKATTKKATTKKATTKKATTKKATTKKATTKKATTKKATTKKATTKKATTKKAMVKKATVKKATAKKRART
jgi:DNA-binding protein HU-beta